MLGHGNNVDDAKAIIRERAAGGTILLRPAAARQYKDREQKGK
jgi:hypothetical protein